MEVLDIMFHDYSWTENTFTVEACYLKLHVLELPVILTQLVPLSFQTPFVSLWVRGSGIQLHMVEHTDNLE